jgi:dihydrofolate reductase
MPRFTLLVAATADGFIAREPGHPPADWCSPEEQAVFLAAVDAADWGIMGRTTHEAAYKPFRRRIVTSTPSQSRAGAPKTISGSTPRASRPTICPRSSPRAIRFARA